MPKLPPHTHTISRRDEKDYEQWLQEFEPDKAVRLIIRDFTHLINFMENNTAYDPRNGCVILLQKRKTHLEMDEKELKTLWMQFKAYALAGCAASEEVQERDLSAFADYDRGMYFVEKTITEELYLRFHFWLNPDTSNEVIAEEDKKLQKEIRNIYIEARKVWEELVSYIKWRNEELSRVPNPTPALPLEQTTTVERHERNKNSSRARNHTPALRFFRSSRGTIKNNQGRRNSF